MKRPLLLITVALLSACSMAPEYERPALPVDNVFPTEDALSGPASAAYDTGWREYFQDPRLQQFIALAINNNRDLRVAALNIEAARATYRVTRSDQLPSLSATGQGSRSERNDVISSSYQAGVNIPSYELDFFGRVKSLSEAALNQYLATEEAGRAAQISLVSQVAIAYFTERLAYEQLQVAKDTLKSNQGSFNLVKQQVDAGIASELDLKQSETQVYSAKVQIAQLEREQKQAENALYLLLGVRPTTNALAKAVSLKNQNLLASFSPGLPSDVLLLRPDVLEAERNLKAENANIGAARAAFFPRIALTANYGSQSAELSDLFTGGTTGWGFSPSIDLPIFDFGSRRANLDLAEVRKNIAVANYEKTIQTAFKEVSDALVAQEPYKAQIKEQTNLTQAHNALLSLSTLRYNNGIASYLDVLDAQRSLFVARQSLLSVYYGQLVNAVNLYAAMGGGVVESHQIDNIKEGSKQAETIN